MHELREVDRAEVANPPFGKALLTARVHADDLLVVPGIRLGVVPVDEDEARLTSRPGRVADLVPEVARPYGLLDLTVPDKIPRGIGLDGSHERIGDADGQVRVIDALEVALDVDELLDVRMAVIDHQHQGATARSALLDHVTGCDGVELCPRTRSRGSAVDGLDVRPTWPEAREVDPDATTTGHDLGHDLQVVEDPATAVFGARDDVAVVVGDLVAGSRSGEDAPARDELEVAQDLVEAALPVLLLLGGGLNRGNTAGNTRPHLFWGVLDWLPALILQRVPVREDLPANTFKNGPPDLGNRRGSAVLHRCHRPALHRRHRRLHRTRKVPTGVGQPPI